MLSAASGCELSTTTCVKTSWKQFKELLPVLSSHHLSFKTCGHVYSSCMWNAMLHPVRLGHWQSQASNICSGMSGQGSDRSTMSGQDIVTTRSNELLARLGIEDLDFILERRLRWYGHVKCSNGADKTAFDIKIERKDGPGRLKMTWKQ